jgi:hypothetical protein
MQRLTSREREIALPVCTSLSNKHIAQQLTEGTVNVHRRCSSARPEGPPSAIRARLTGRSRQVDGRYYEVATRGSMAERLTSVARDRIYADFLRFCAPAASDKILDIGVSDVVGDAANVLERRYFPQEQITAVGLGSGEEFKESFPKIQYRQIVANQPLPFKDGSFDVVTSNAVLEHVGSLENQRFFMSEMMRVGGRVFLTVPHRFFPVEHHTAIPFLHWADSSFRLACKLLNKEKWAASENLILMSRSRLTDACPEGVTVKIGTTGITLGPWSSNLYLFTLGPRSRTSSGSRVAP